MNHKLEIIYDPENAENLDGAEELASTIEELEANHPDIAVAMYDFRDIDEDEREDLEERFGEDLCDPMIIFNDEILFTDYPSKDELMESIEVAMENAELNAL